MAQRRMTAMLAALAAIACAQPALADVKDGVDAWSRGEWDAAIAEWRGPAQAGDADALFNMGQAYRLGRGVPQDDTTAEAYYLRAAQAGHLRAADTYGLLLFQDGRREAALPYIEGAAGRGDPRAQYLLGVAHFNGDIVGKDWVRAYALLTLANGQGLPQAAPALAEMDKHVPLAQRQQAASLALQMQQEADATRTRELATADLSMGAAAPVEVVTTASLPSTPAPSPVVGVPVQNSTPRVPQPVVTAPVVASSARVPQPIDRIEVEPSVTDARLAVQQAMTATGTEDPALAGADYARPDSAPSRPVQVAAPRPAPVSSPAPPVSTAPVSTGQWKLQLGAFSVRGNAERLLASLINRPELAGREAQLVPTGRLTRLLVDGYASRAEAQSACNSLARAGQDCVVTQR